MQDYPLSPYYRYDLKPYLYKHVHIVSTNGWDIAEEFDNRYRICIRNAVLYQVDNGKFYSDLYILIEHLNFVVDDEWLASADPQPDEELDVNGMLYEYVSKGFRNIGIFPVIITPVCDNPFGSILKVR